MGLKIDKKFNLIPKILGWAILAILVILMAKILIWENDYYRTKSSQERAETVSVLDMVGHIAHPDETPTSDEAFNTYQVEADEPRYLYIDRLDVKAIVKKSNTANSDILSVPDNIYEAMWYYGSARPGQGRNIIITGLSAGDTKDGIFKNIDSLEKGNEIRLINGNGFEYIYEVAELSILQESEMSTKLNDIQKQIDNTETLSLITTNVVDNIGTYDSIAIVRATLKSSTQLQQ